MSVYQVPAENIIKALAAQFKEDFPEITPPAWAQYVKTGCHRENAPEDPDWWFIRAAAILRRVRIAGPIGVSHLRKIYGGRQRNGTKPDHFRRGSGNIIRKILKQLEEAELVQTFQQKGRVTTNKGESLLDRTAYEIMKEIPALQKYLSES
ncbi:MAG: 30S ribosomal protein S19e [Candidatus Hodarchaeota archaeon]